MAFEPALPVTELTQELRLATTMTGGVSLAIWMAGVAREINLLVQASQWRREPETTLTEHPLSDESAESFELYAKLIDLLDVVVDVDILSGTSAGGINAALLAFSRVRGRDLGKLRDIWLDLGALTELIRDPTEKNTPSLLYGDKRMLAALAEQIPDLAEGPFRPPENHLPSTTLYVTATLLTGETSRFSDSYNTLVQDVDYHGVFTFTEEDLAKEANDLALALAARSSASFPLAFEPSFIPFRRDVPEQEGVPRRPRMEPFANITQPHWVADGGLLDNQPIDVLLQRVFDRPAHSAVRRVLLFVVPSAGPAPNLVEDGVLDDVNAPLGLLNALLKDLATVTKQSIAADLRTIREHQDRMEARTDAKLRLAEFAADKRSRLLTENLLTDYEMREATNHAQALTSALLRQLSTWPSPSTKSIESIPEKWESELKIGGDAERVCRRRIRQSIRSTWSPQPDERPLPQSLADFARYGRPAYDLAKACALAVVQAAYQLAESDDHMTALGKLTAAICGTRDPKRVDARVLAYTMCTRYADREKSLGDAAEALAGDYLHENGAEPEDWERLGQALVDYYGTLIDLAATASASPLQTYLNYFGQLGDSESAAMKLFDLAATQRALLPAGADIEQPLEFVQVSADTRTLLAPDIHDAQKKLTGMQFHHFGAFYKRSWRANDWTWGRLDGTGWLVHLLLDPRRVRWIVKAHADEHPMDADEKKSGALWLINKLKELANLDLPDAHGTTEDTLRNELAFLDNTTTEMPRSIPNTALWLAQAWQRRVLDEELDVLAKTVIDPQKPGTKPDWSPAKSQEWANQVLTTPEREAKYQLWKDNPIAAETFATDKRSPLMAQTITKAAATGSAAVGSVQQMPGVLKPALITLRTLALGGYRVVSRTKGVARKTIIAGAVLLVLGLGVAMLPIPQVGPWGLLVAGVGGYAIVLGTWQVSRKALVAALSFTFVLAVFALTTSCVRTWLFGTDKGHSGVVGSHIYLLGTQWWYPLIALLVLALAITLTAVAISRRR